MEIEEKCDIEEHFNGLLNRIAQKDEEAFKALFDFYGRLIRTSAVSIMKSSAFVDDILNEVVIKIWKISRKSTKVKNPSGLIYKMTVNCAKDRLRKLKRQQKIVGLVDVPFADPNLNNVDENDAFAKMIENLKITEQQIMIFKFVEGFPFNKIAEILNKPISTVTSTYYRAIEKIKNKK